MDANISLGKPTIRGLRYPVENILEWLSSGMSVDEVLADYEDLERKTLWLHWSLPPPCQG
jgi:uncharacterized protein (DUF433 family)